MSDMMLRGAGFPLLIIAIPVLLLAWRRHRRRRPVTRCPGPRRLRSFVDPVRLFWRSGCHYDLTALGADSGGRVRCPECARVVAPSRFVRTAYRLRAWRAGAAMLLVGIALCITPAIRTGRLTAMLPTMALVVTEHIDARPPAKLDRELRQELRARLAGNEVRSWEMRSLIAARVNDLRDDDVKWNAQQAISFLIDQDAAAVPALEAALRSADWQERQLAAHVLRRIPTYVPGDELFRVTLESMRSDDLPSGPDSYTPIYNASESTRYLAVHVRAAEAHLVRGLGASETQQRILCACVLVRARREAHYDRAVPILIDHLRDNDIPGDAADARSALRAGGPTLIPMLEPFADSDDAQQQRYVRRVLRHLRREVSRPTAP